MPAASEIHSIDAPSAAPPLEGAAGGGARDRGADDAAPERGRLTERFLRVPLFWKLTVANAAVAVLIYVLGLWVGLRIAPRVGTASLVGIAGGSLLLAAVAGFLLNALLVRLALSPLRRLEETARRVGEGELDVRAGASPLADRELTQLMERFDEMLDTLDRARARQRVLASRVLESEERTRRWIARQLYDDIGQRVASMLILIPTAWRSEEEGGSDAVLERIREGLAQALERIRASARRLRPPELDDLGLAAALRAEVRTFEEQSGRVVELDAPPDLPEPPRSAALALFRLVQEALSVAGRGDAAAPIRVELAARNGEILGSVCQEGSELAASLSGRDGSAMGIDEMRERADYVDGGASLTTVDGRSVLRLRIPASEPSTTRPAGPGADRARTEALRR